MEIAPNPQVYTHSPQTTQYFLKTLERLKRQKSQGPTVVPKMEGNWHRCMHFATKWPQEWDYLSLGVNKSHRCATFFETPVSLDWMGWIINIRGAFKKKMGKVGLLDQPGGGGV